MRKSLAFGFSFCLVSTLISFFWIVGILGQRPDIPPQTPNVSYEDIILHRAQRNPLDDFVLSPPIP